MASIDWGKIAGSVVGGVVNFFAPGTGDITSKLVEKGVDIATDVISKVKSKKQAGASDEEIAKSLTSAEKAKLVGETNEMSKEMAAADAAFSAWIASESEADKMLSRWRKSAKIRKMNPDSLETYRFDGAMLYFGDEALNVANLVIFKGFPNFTTANEVVQSAMNGVMNEGTVSGGGTMTENYVPDETATVKNVKGQGGVEQPTHKKSSSTWLWLVALFFAVFYFFVMKPASKRAKALRAARAARKKAQNMKKAEMNKRMEALRKRRKSKKNG